MILPTETDALITLTAEIVSAHVASNDVAPAEIAALIQSVFTALQAADAPKAEPEAERPKAAVSVRASIKPDHILSMIDGKPYKMLRRHLSLNGYTPETYRETFGLPKDYPMVAASYSETRRGLAHKIGLGRKSKAVELAPEPAKPASRPKLKIAVPKSEPSAAE